VAAVDSSSLPADWAVEVDLASPPVDWVVGAHWVEEEDLARHLVDLAADWEAEADLARLPAGWAAPGARSAPNHHPLGAANRPVEGWEEAEVVVVEEEVA
jgi:hypothetical protein